MYIAYYCSKCRTEFILLSEQVKIMKKEGRYVACPFGHRYNLSKLDRYGSIKEVMEGARVYKKVKGRVRQIK